MGTTKRSRTRRRHKSSLLFNLLSRPNAHIRIFVERHSAVFSFYFDSTIEERGFVASAPNGKRLWWARCFQRLQNCLQNLRTMFTFLFLRLVSVLFNKKKRYFYISSATRANTQALPCLLTLSTNSPNNQPYWSPYNYNNINNNQKYRWSFLLGCLPPPPECSWVSPPSVAALPVSWSSLEGHVHMTSHVMPRGTLKQWLF